MQLDNRPNFTSHIFAEFIKDWNIMYSTSSPRNPRKNGQAEAAVKILKDSLLMPSALDRTTIADSYV